MLDIRDGRRSVPEMVPFVSGLSDEDIADISAFAAQAPSAGGAKEELVALGQRVYRGGIEERGIPACIACHGPNGNGIEPAMFPRLAGQHATTVTQLNKFSMNESERR